MCARVKCVLCMLCCVLLSETMPVPHVYVTSVPCTCRACHCAVHVLCVRCVCVLICRHATCIYHAWVMCHDRAVPFVRCRSVYRPFGASDLPAKPLSGPLPCLPRCASAAALPHLVTVRWWRRRQVPRSCCGCCCQIQHRQHRAVAVPYCCCEVVVSRVGAALLQRCSCAQGVV